MIDGMGSPVRNLKIEAESRRREISTEKARRAEQLDAYIAAFIGTAQEFSPELEETSIESWLNEEGVDNSKRRNGEKSTSSIYRDTPGMNNKESGRQ